jgi:hypothetical protein
VNKREYRIDNKYLLDLLEHIDHLANIFDAHDPEQELEVKIYYSKEEQKWVADMKYIEKISTYDPSERNKQAAELWRAK